MVYGSDDNLSGAESVLPIGRGLAELLKTGWRPARTIDPGWKYHVAIAKVVGLAAMRLADADVVPLHYTGYAGEVGRYLNQMTAQQNRVFGHEVVSLASDKMAAAEWREAARGIQSRINNELRQGAGPGRLNRLTIQLEQVERDLLVARGLPGRHWSSTRSTRRA